MTTEQFLLGLRRFIAIHGIPVELTSDNAAHFKLSAVVVDAVWNDILVDTDITTYTATRGIKWKCIVELAPWVGGYYGRHVGLVKRCLRKAIGNVCLINEQLLTYLKEAESVINTRPITYVGDDINSGIVVTPAHFLTLNPKLGVPESHPEDQDDSEFKPVESTADRLEEIWKKGQRLLNQFWKMWKHDYLVSLRERFQTKLKASRIQSHDSAGVGNVVQIHDNLPRGSWKIGMIHELGESGDGQVRSARVRLPSGRMIGRALNMLHPIECNN